MHNITENGEARDIRVTSYADTSPVVSEDEDTAGGGTGSSDEDSADGTTDDADDDSEDADDGEDAGADDSDDSDGTTDDDADQAGSGEGDEVGRDVVDRGRQFAGAISGADGHPIWQ